MRTAFDGRAIICVAVLATGVTEAAEPGFYVGVGAGRSEYEVGRGDGILVSISGPFGSGGIVTVYPESTEVDDGGVSWAATLGYRIHKYVAAEVAYLDLAHADTNQRYRVPPMSPFSSGFTIDREAQISVSGPALSVLGIFPLGAGFEPYVRAGVLFADLEHETLSPLGSSKVTFGSEELFGGVGLQWSFADRWAVRVEYQRVNRIAGSARNGTVELDHLTLGATFSL